MVSDLESVSSVVSINISRDKRKKKLIPLLESSLFVVFITTVTSTNFWKKKKKKKTIMRVSLCFVWQAKCTLIRKAWFCGEKSGFAIW